jgi:hypothetical protein
MGWAAFEKVAVQGRSPVPNFCQPGKGEEDLRLKSVPQKTSKFKVLLLVYIS